ncbi:DUF3330 domain-containing protein [Escherichia coli]|uniref:DUF3330 domain-containing protein n=1 Tax=Escherichia coli TaxID=562 RepID=UPI00388F7B56
MNRAPGGLLHYCCKIPLDTAFTPEGAGTWSISAGWCYQRFERGPALRPEPRQADACDSPPPG